MEEAPENGKESSHSAHANGIGIDMLGIFHSGYSVPLCCSVYYLCVNVYCTAATGFQTNFS
jgi:hypothetical protein